MSESELPTAIPLLSFCLPCDITGGPNRQLEFRRTGDFVATFWR